MQLEDEQEKFDRLQMELLMENPDSAAFYNAKMRTQRRVSEVLSLASSPMNTSPDAFTFLAPTFAVEVLLLAATDDDNDAAAVFLAVAENARRSQ